MEKIPYSFLGYNKKCVNRILNEKNSQLESQQLDINYLRNEIERLENVIEVQKNKLND